MVGKRCGKLSNNEIIYTRKRLVCGFRKLLYLHCSSYLMNYRALNIDTNELFSLEWERLELCFEKNNMEKDVRFGFDPE